MRIPQMAVQPMVMPNKTANTITVRATGPVVDVIERVSAPTTSPAPRSSSIWRFSRSIRERIKRYGINLPRYNLNVISRRKWRRPTRAGGAVASPPPFNLNTISQGVSTEQYVTV